MPKHRKRGHATGNGLKPLTLPPITFDSDASADSTSQRFDDFEGEVPGTPLLVTESFAEERPWQLRRLLPYLARKLLLRKRVAIFVLLVAVTVAGREAPITAVDSVPAGLRVEDSGRPGRHYPTDRIKHRRPIVIVPGFVTSGLELWRYLPCFDSNITSLFRQRIFNPQMLLNLVRDPECYMAHVALNRTDASDPHGVALRTDEGFSTVDYLVGNFWVWAKMMVNFADVGYLPSDMYVAPYDWRLSAALAEERDGFMSKLKWRVEHLVARSGHRAVVVSHSYGSNVFVRFLQWADAREPGWTDRHVHSFVNVGGPMMGMPKALAAVLSGEFRDTAMLPYVTQSLLDVQLTHELRARTFRTWPCLAEMLPRGPAALFAATLTVSDAASNTTRELNHVEALRLLEQTVGDDGFELLAEYVRQGDLGASLPESVRIPAAPRMTVYCTYGINQTTETGYSYHVDAATGRPTRIDTGLNNSGVHLGTGDATVPLLSLAYPCRAPHAWRAAAKVKTVEFPHEGLPLYVDPRGGTATADHVDIMGNYELIHLVLDVATGNEADVTERILSDVDARLDAVLAH